MCSRMDKNCGNIGAIDVFIDDITPCLKDNTTGDIVETEVIRIRRKSFLSKFNKKNGWYTNWSSLASENEIYALVTKGTVDIQGLVALRHEQSMGATYIAWMCTAPHNNNQISDNAKYSGVGGHLFAIAGRESVKAGFDGAVYGFAANQQVMNHYVERLGATPIQMLHPYHFMIFEEDMQKLIDTYSYEFSDEEI